MGTVDDKVAVIIGAGRGIGRAVALLFASEGARVVVNDNGTAPDGKGADARVAEAVAEEIRTAGGTAIANAEDATGEGSAERVIAMAIERFGRLDALVYAAGIAGDEPLARIDSETWNRVLAVHLTGAVHATRAAAIAMQKQKNGGRIVLTTSAAGLVGNFGASAYSAAAAGVFGLMRTASVELQRRSIYVNAVAPIAKTRLTGNLPMFEHVDTMTPEHTAPAYLFLGSDLAGDLTGNVLAVAGGRISQYKVTETAGSFKEGDPGIWSAEEIREQWNRTGKP